MANRSYLYMSESVENFVSTIPENQILAAGRYVIPIFWFTAFAGDDIHEAIYTMESEESGDDVDVPLAALRTTKDVALKRAMVRRDSCFRILPDSLQPLYDQWLALLKGMEMPHLHIGAEEIWMMGPETYADFLYTCVRAMEEFRREDWDILLAHASIEYHPSTKHVSAQEAYGEDVLPYLLRGGSWLRAVPWQE